MGSKIRVSKIISLAFLLFSLILFTFGKNNILGLAIAELETIQAINYSLAILFFIAGLLIFLAQQLLEERIHEPLVTPTLNVQEIRHRISELAESYEKDRIELGEAVMTIDGIANVKPIDYSRGYFAPIHLDEKAFTFESGKLNSRIPIKMHDILKKRALFYGLLELTVRKQRRGLIDSRYQIRPDIQVRIGKEIESSKHYPQLVQKHIQDYDRAFAQRFDRYLANYLS